jgi:hypothetical protein
VSATEINHTLRKELKRITGINHTLRKALKRITGWRKLLARRKASSPNKPYDTNPYQTDSHSHRNVDPVVDKALRGLLVSANDGDVSSAGETVPCE